MAISDALLEQYKLVMEHAKLDNSTPEAMKIAANSEKSWYACTDAEQEFIGTLCEILNRIKFGPLNSVG